MTHQVQAQRVTGHKLNSELVDWLKTHPYLENEDYYRTVSVAYRAMKWRLRDRLTERDMVRLIMAFERGMAAKALAEEYGINVKSVRRLLREHEAITHRYTTISYR